MAKVILTQREITIAEWRQYWPTGIASIVGMGLGLSVIPTISSLFIEPLQQTFGWSRGQIALAQNASLIGAFVAPPIGRMIDNFGARRLIVGGFLMMGLFYLALAAMQGPIGFYYLCYTGLTIAGSATSGLGFSRVLAATFVRSRGLSLALGRSGLAISSAVLPSALFGIMSIHGWRAGYILMAGLTLAVAGPLCWFCIERRQAAPIRGEAPPRWLTLLSDRRILTVALAAALAYTPLLAIITQLKPLLVDAGLEAGTAVRLIGLLGISSLVGAILTGFLIDRYWAPLIAVIMMAGAALGAIALLNTHGNVYMAATGVLLLGLAQGAELDIVSFVVARYFGMRAFGSIYGITVFAIATGTAGGATLIGFLYDRSGGYDLALMLAAGTFLLSGLSYLSLGRYPPIEADLRPDDAPS